VITRQEGAEENPFMGDRLIISDNREDPGNPLVLDGEAIDAAAQDPLAIGKLMVDQVWAEGTNPTGGGLYYERNSNQHRRLQAFETGSEDFMTGGWVRVLASAEQDGGTDEDPWHPPRRRAAGGVPGRSLGLSRSAYRRPAAWKPITPLRGARSD
jgi:hypothetical protein